MSEFRDVVSTIEMDIAVNKMTAMQAFTQMKQLISDLERRNKELEMALLSPKALTRTKEQK